MVSKRSAADSGGGDAIIQKFKPRVINFEEKREKSERKNVKSVIKMIIRNNGKKVMKVKIRRWIICKIISKNYKIYNDKVNVIMYIINNNLKKKLFLF